MEGETPSPSQASDEVGQETAVDPMVAVYRHDLHKLRARRHSAAADEYAGVRVNEQVPLGADVDAALLSRPRGEPEQTVANHLSPYRLSLLTGSTVIEPARIHSAADGGFRNLIASDEPEQLHARWLASDLASVYSESVYYPYTSLKYHTLLAAALLDNYRAGCGFDELALVATSPAAEGMDVVGGTDDIDAETLLSAASVEPNRTILWTPALALHLTPTPKERPAAMLGTQPARSFADVWARLPAHPIETDDRYWRMLDAQLRRIRSWSAALQYIADILDRFGTAITQRREGDHDAW